MSLFKEKFTWFFIPNSIIDNSELFRAMPPNAAKLLLYLARKTFGFHKESESFSLRYLERAIGVSRPTLIEAAKWLEANDILSRNVTRTATRFSIVIKPEPEPSAVKDFDQQPSAVKDFDQRGKKSLPQVVKILYQIKESKINTNKINSLIRESLQDVEKSEFFLKLLEKKGLTGKRALSYLIAIIENEIDAFPHKYTDKTEQRIKWKERYSTIDRVIIEYYEELSNEERHKIENDYSPKKVTLLKKQQLTG